MIPPILTHLPVPDYSVVLPVGGDQAGVAFWREALDQGVSRADVLAGFSESGENVAAAALAFCLTMNKTQLYSPLLRTRAALLAGTGFVYVPDTAQSSS